MNDANKGAIGLIVVLLLGAAGYLWFTQMYKPAVAERETAVAAATSAEGELQKAKSELAAAQQQADEAKKAASKPDDSVAKVQVATKAIPQKELVDDAAIVLMDLADRAGISTNFNSKKDDANGTSGSGADGSVQGASHIDLTFEAAGTSQEMMNFISYVEDTVQARHGKLYATDRLFNVVRLEIGDSKDGGSSSGSVGEDEKTGLVVGPNDMVFTVTVRMYTSSTDNASTVGASTPDPAAAPTDASGASGDPAANGGAAPADGSTGTAPDGSASTPSGTGGEASAAQPATAGAGAPSTGGNT